MQKILYFIFLLTTFLQSYAQNKTLHVQIDTVQIEESLLIDEELMQEIKEKNEFNYEQYVSEESWWENFTIWLSKKWNQLLETIFGDIQPDSFVYFLTQILPYIIVGGVLIFIIWLFIKLNPGQNVLAKAESNQIFFSNEEELIKTKDLVQLKEDALQKKNYRLAVRYWYLQILQQLDKRNLIEYQFEKTNTDYAEELQHKDFVISFKQTTNYYNFAWYGGFEINEMQFQKVNRLFQQLQQQISTQHG